MQGPCVVNLGTDTSSLQFIHDRISVVNVNHKLVEAMLVYIGTVNQAAHTRVSKTLHPVSSNCFTTSLPVIEIAGFDHHLRTVYFAHATVGHILSIAATFAIALPVSCKVQQLSIVCDHSTTIAVVGKVLGGIKADGTCSTMTPTVIG